MPSFTILVVDFANPTAEFPSPPLKTEHFKTQIVP